VPEGSEGAVKCPKCGFVSHPGLAKCKKCGHSFTPPARKETSSLLSTLLSLGSLPSRTQPKASGTASAVSALPSPTEGAAPGPLTEPHIDEPQPTQSSASVSSVAEAPVASPSAPPATALAAAGMSSPQLSAPIHGSQEPWREELSGRVQQFRHRRARLRRGFDPTNTLDLDFKSDEGSQGGGMDQQENDFAGRLEEAERQLGRPPEPSASEPGGIDSVPLEKSGSGIRVLSAAAVEVGELRLAPHESASEPMEIVLDSAPPSGRDGQAQPSPILDPRALLGRRFVAGLADATVLLLSAALFGGIFWYLAARGAPGSGPVSLRPSNLALLGVIAALLVFSYFGMSVALSGSTPGLAWMGLEVRNLEGNFPSSRESFGRAFGYMVSISALFLGFVWAIFDADAFTWHDLMSGTYVRERS